MGRKTACAICGIAFAEGDRVAKYWTWRDGARSKDFDVAHATCVGGPAAEQAESTTRIGAEKARAKRSRAARIA